MADILKKVFNFNRLSACAFFSTLMRTAPDFSFLTDFGEPAIETKHFSMTKCELEEIGGSGKFDSINRMRKNEEFDVLPFGLSISESESI